MEGKFYLTSCTILWRNLSKLLFGVDVKKKNQGTMCDDESKKAYYNLLLPLKPQVTSSCDSKCIDDFK